MAAVVVSMLLGVAAVALFAFVLHLGSEWSAAFSVLQWGVW